MGPGTIKDYKLLLQLCEDLKNYSGNISKVETIVLDWIYPFCKEAVDRGVNIDATKFIVNYYETRLKRPEDDTPVMENVRTPPSKKVPTQLKDDSSDEEDTPPISPLPKKKIQKLPRQDIWIPDDERYMRFKYLNTYKKEAELRKYCKKYDIKIEDEYNMKKIKMAIMEFYKDEKKYPWPPI